MVTVEFLRQNFKERKALRCYLLLRSNGLGYAGYTENHIEFLQSKGYSQATAYRFINKLTKLGWITVTPKGVKVKSVHRITNTRNRYAISISNDNIATFSIFEAYLFASLLLSKCQADYKRKLRDERQHTKEESVESSYRSFDLHTMLTTDYVGADYLGITKSMFNRIKKISCRLGFLKVRYALNKKINFKTKSEALNFLGHNPMYKRVQKVEDIYYIVYGSVYSINSILFISQYAGINRIQKAN